MRVTGIRLTQSLAALALVLSAVACSGGASKDDAAEDPAATAAGDGTAHAYVTRPDLTPPVIDVSDSGDAGSLGDDPVFLATKDEGSPMNGPLIVDGDGEPIWMHPLGDRWAYDFRVQQYDGEPVLTWWEGDTDSEGYGQGQFVIADRSYRQIATVTSHGTELADFHDMTLTTRGTALLTSYPTVKHDLSAEGGPKDGYLLDCVVQEIDVKTGKVLFEWSALDHIPLLQTEIDASSDEDETGTKAGPLDPYHVNSVAEDGKDALLISARNTHAIYRVDRSTGAVDWALGGSDSDFDMLGDSEFAWQHDAQRQPDGTITLFDNESSPPVGDRSRGLRLALDMDKHTARVVTEFLPPDGRLSDSQGNVQVLDNGNVFVGWGAQPYYSEYTSDGKLLSDARLEAGISYRAFRQPWHAQPSEPPRFIYTDDTAYVSWNGATEVVSWRFVSGEGKASATTVKTVERDGFETSLAMPDRPYIAAQALDASGKVLATAEPGSWP